jgi:hypothetical protein
MRSRNLFDTVPNNPLRSHRGLHYPLHPRLAAAGGPTSGRSRDGGVRGRNGECGKHTAADVIAKAQAVMSEAELLRAMYAVDCFPPNTPHGTRF